MKDLKFISSHNLEPCLTPDKPLIHTSFTYSKLNMDVFSVLTGPSPLGYEDKTQEVEWKSLHAQIRSFLLLNL